MPAWLRILRIWLPSALALTLLVGFSYVAVQQVYRTSADDPQLQLAQDAAARLADGAPLEAVVPTGTVDIAKSLSPFVIVYGSDNTPLAGSGTLDGTLPTPPIGVLDTARSADENRVTWQPRAGVRIASVETAVGDGRVVLAGRSLREVETRVGTLTATAGLVWLIGVFASLVVAVLLDLLGRKSTDARSNVPA